ncbi:MAG: hypothetical protein WCZ66_00325 [Sphingomonadaceae bacterium]
MMRSLTLIAGLAFAAAAGVMVSTPAAAQGGNYRTRTIVVFGNDECPKATNPDEIIVCARRPEEERYRIPKPLREAEKAAAAARVDDVGTERAALVDGRRSATGIGSCSAVGPGGGSGCTRGLDVMGVGRTIVEGVETATEPTDD